MEMVERGQFLVCVEETELLVHEHSSDKGCGTYNFESISFFRNNNLEDMAMFARGPATQERDQFESSSSMAERLQSWANQLWQISIAVRG